MPNEVEDAQEFVNKAEQYKEKGKKEYPKAVDEAAPLTASNEECVMPGQVTQYAIYGEGYTSTTPTIKTLPSNCYDIIQDNKCVFVVPSLPHSGLLLELPEMRSNDVINVIENFWNSEDDYKNGNEFVIGGARYSSGILIFGPPGSGKSCTIQICNNKLIERKGTVFYASNHPGSVISFLTDFAKIEKERKSIVILEDIDSLIEKYRESAYLEMLDSAKTINNVCFIATTNYPERLDPRIWNRPGRFSHVIKVGLPGERAREAYLKAILKNHRDIPEIVEKSSGFTIDHLTALINSVYREKKNLNTEIIRLRTLFKMPQSHDKMPMGINSTEWDNAGR